MMRALVALLILSAFAAHAQLLVTEQQPSPNGCQWAAQYQQDSRNDPGDAIPAPTLLPADTKAEKGCPDSSEGHVQGVDKPSGWENWLSDPTIFATLVIAAFTVVLAFSTIFLYKSTNKAAVAGAASVESLKRIERPWMLMDGYKLINYPPTQPPGDIVISKDWLMVKFKWTNAGKSPAFVMAHESKLIILAEDEALPERWDVDSISNDDHDHPIIGGGHFGARALHEKVTTIGAELWENINSKKCRLFFRAYIRYRDIFGVVHESRYCAVFELLPKNLTAINTKGGKEYNCQT